MRDLLRELAIVYLPGAVLLMIGGGILGMLGYELPGLVVLAAGGGMFVLLILILTTSS